jgi:hypothetical protein
MRTLGIGMAGAAAFTAEKGIPSWPADFDALLARHEIDRIGIGLLTPPVGSALYVGCAIGEIKIEKILKGMLPFYATMLVVLMIITYFPEIANYIPHLFGFKA